MYFFTAFLNENILVFDKQSCFSFIVSPTFIKMKRFETMEKEKADE